MRNRAESTQVQVPVKVPTSRSNVFFIEVSFRDQTKVAHLLFQHLKALFTDATTNKLTDLWHQQVHTSHSLAALGVRRVLAHVECLDICWVVCHEDWPIDVLFSEETFMLRLQIHSPFRFLFKANFTLAFGYCFLKNRDSFRIGQTSKVILDHSFQSFSKLLVVVIVKEGDIFGAIIQCVCDRTLHSTLSGGYALFKPRKGHFRFDHPEFGMAMSLLKAFGQALQRSVEVARDETAKMMRMEISPTSKNQGALLIYAMTQPAHLTNFATGSDSDIGGLSQCRLGLDESSRGRFYGTLSSQVPRGGKIEKSGYAGFRNRNRPTLFGNQCWDTTVHPYLALRVRNRLAKKPIAGADKSEHADAGAGSGLRAALHASGPSGPATSRAVHALGLGRKELPGPKFFVNIQTDGPVTSDLFQHRLYLDESKGSNWQTVIIPFNDFVLTNTGQVSNSQVSMMREKIRTVGISSVLDVPVPPSASKPPSKDAPPSALSRNARESEQEEDDWAVDGDLRADDNLDTALRGSKRGATFNFDLGVESVYAVGELEELDGLFQH